MKNSRRYWLVAILFGAAIPLACQSGNANLGNTGAAGASPVDGAPPVSPRLAGSWDGYVEAYSFSVDGSDRVRLTVASNTQGTLEIGDAPTLAPPTDPNVGYPPQTGPIDLPPGNAGLFEGFLYPIHAPDISAQRIQLGVDPNDIYATWCAIQTSYPRGQYQSAPDAAVETSYGCTPEGIGWGTGGSGLPDAGPDAGPGCALFSPDGGQVDVDCGKEALCAPGVSACTCSATGCTLRSLQAGLFASDYPILLDVSLDDTGTTLTGTLALSGTRLNVHLQRQ